MSIIYISVLISIFFQATSFSYHSVLASKFSMILYAVAVADENHWLGWGSRRYSKTKKSEARQKGTEASQALSTPSPGPPLRSALSCGIISMDLEHQSSAEGGATMNALGTADGLDSPEWWAHKRVGESSPPHSLKLIVRKFSRDTHQLCCTFKSADPNLVW